jgi:hypothetical protein
MNIKISTQESDDEIIQYTISQLSHVKNIESIAGIVFEKFTRITNPEVTSPEIDTKNYLIKLNSLSGIGGGSTYKLGNIVLNWKKLLVTSSESILTIAGAVAAPYLIPLAALVIWNKVWSLLDIKISENHAIVVAALWSYRNVDTNVVITTDLLQKVNSHFGKYTQKQLSKDELNSLINDLSDLKILELNANGSIWLREWVKQPYS